MFDFGMEHIEESTDKGRENYFLVVFHSKHSIVLLKIGLRIIAVGDTWLLHNHHKT